MLRVRVIPALLLRDGALVKTRRFRGVDYIGDPCNTLRIFNELEVDELVVLDTMASRRGSRPDWALLKDIAEECFMPLAYGGGIRGLDDARRIFDTGFEKVIVNSSALANPRLLTEIAQVYGSQAVVVAIDVKTGMFGLPRVWSHGARRRTGAYPEQWARRAQAAGAGEILLTSVDREGTWGGPDLDLIRAVANAVEIPVIAQGGIGNVGDMVAAVERGGASSVAVGAMVVYQKKDFGVLVNFPERHVLEDAFRGVRIDGDATEPGTSA